MIERVSNKVGYILLLLWCASACSADNIRFKTEVSEITGKNMCDFEKINLDSNLMNSCSPSTDELDLSWQGILINMPAVFKAVEKDEEASIISRNARIPLCITIQFKLKNMINYEFPRDAISVVVVDRKTGKNFTNNLTYQGSRAPNPVASYSEEELEKSISTAYYSVNLTHYIELPLAKTTYDLYATFEEFKSNSMKFSIE